MSEFSRIQIAKQLTLSPSVLQRFQSVAGSEPSVLPNLLIARGYYTASLDTHSTMVFGKDKTD